MKKSIFLFFAAILCSVSAWAADANSAEIYYDNTKSQWPDVQLFIGKSDWNSINPMTKIANTNNLYCLYNFSWGGYSSFYFTTGVAGWNPLANNENVDSRSDWATCRSAKQTTSLGSSVNLYISTGTSKGASVTRNTITDYKDLNYKQTVQQQLTSDGTSYSASTEAIATVKVSSYKLGNATATSATANNGSITSGSSSAECEAARTATVTYSVTGVNSAYTFVGWYDGDTQKSTSSTYTYQATEAKTITARFAVATEEEHEVTITYVCGSNTVSAATSAYVGVETEKSFTAPTVTGYNFTGWTKGAGIIEKSSNENTITILTKTGETDYSLVANYEEVMETVYFINSGNWADVYIHLWNGTAVGTEWPGTQLTATGTKIGEYDVYEYTAQQGAHANLLFHKKDNDSQKTTDLTWTAGKYYIHKYGDKTGWYTYAEADALLNVIPDCYITGNKELVGGEGWKADEVKMTYNNASSTYSHTFLASTLVVGTEYKLKVTDGTWTNHWGAINGTIEGVSNDADGNVCFKLSTVGDVTVTFDGAKVTLSTTGAFYVPVVYDYYIAGSMNSWAQNNEDYGMSKVGETTTYAKELTLAAGTYEFKVKGNSWYGYTDIVGEYEEISEGKDGEGNPNGNVQLKLTASKTFTVNFDSNTKKITFTDLTEIIPTYTVAGDSEAAFGTTWDPTNTANDMALEGGLYKWTKTNVALYANTKISFKVVKNHDWNKGQWPERDGENDNNWILQDGITADGLYTITITFNESTKEIQATATKTGDIVIKDFSNQPATLYFHPSFHWTSDYAQFAAYFYNNGPGADATPTWVNMTDANSDGIYEVANAKQHEYVIICRMNPGRAENNWDDEVMWNQIEHGITIPNTAGDLNTCLAFWTNCQGDVPTSECTWVAPTPLTDKNWDAFIAAYNGKTINAVVERSFTSGQKHTLCLPFNLPTSWLGDGSKAYQLNSIFANTAEELQLNASECNTIEAGKPYIIVPVKGSEYEHIIVSGVTVKEVAAGTNIATGDGYKATLKAITTTGGQTNGSTEYYVGANDGKLYNAVVDKLGLRAIIELTTTSGQPLPARVRAYVAAEENEATGLDNIQLPNANSQKLIINGQLIIIRDGEMYNAQGVRF